MRSTHQLESRKEEISQGTERTLVGEEYSPPVEERKGLVRTPKGFLRKPASEGHSLPVERIGRDKSAGH
jgi:hypothetical protein